MTRKQRIQHWLKMIGLIPPEEREGPGMPEEKITPIMLRGYICPRVPRKRNGVVPLEDTGPWQDIAIRAWEDMQ